MTDPAGSAARSPDPAGSPARTAVSRAMFAVVWLAVALAISFGAAGVVAGLDHEPSTGRRPELTWAADERVRPALDAAEAELRVVSDRVDELGSQGRGAIAALAARDFDLLNETIGQGTALIAEADNRSAAAAAQLEGLEEFGEDAALRLSPETQARYERLRRAASVTDGLADSWTRLTQGGLAAAQLSGLLAQHDERLIDAIEAGRTGDYDTALERIDEATAALDAATELRNQLATRAVDVSVLDEWLRRSRNYDTALRNLYEATSASPNRVTEELRRALLAEREARADLPENTDALTIIMADIGRGGLNQAVITIEDAKGELADALEGPGEG